MEKLPAVAHLKGFGPRVTEDLFGLDDILNTFIADKGYSPGVVYELSKLNLFGPLVDFLLLKEQAREGNLRTLLNYFGERVGTAQLKHSRITPYRARGAENMRIHHMLAATASNSFFIGQGATSRVSIPDGRSIPNSYIQTPIAIVGYGAAGIMAERGLAQLGFRNITVFESAKAQGIWAKPTVHRGSRNNPRNIEFMNIAHLEHAPGDGSYVNDFLERVGRGRRFTNTSVSKIVPGDLSHKVVLKDGTEHSFPIVINAMGIGAPVPIDDPDRMVGPSGKVVAVRWQEPDLQASDIRGKRFVFVGLGNSTAEMLRQIHSYQDRGIDVDYRVITHYPRDAVYRPMETVRFKGREFRVFRDLAQPNLTSYQGDLPHSRHDYFRALYNGKIISGVTDWDVKAERFAAKRNGKVIEEFDFHRLYVLTGYRNAPATFARMGCLYDEVNRCTPHDYDGELVQSTDTAGVERIHRGYFGFGAVLDSPYNRNTSVIPGMAFHLTDLIFGCLMRAGEYAHSLDTRQAA